MCEGDDGMVYESEGMVCTVSDGGMGEGEWMVCEDEGMVCKGDVMGVMGMVIVMGRCVREGVGRDDV